MMIGDTTGPTMPSSTRRLRPQKPVQPNRNLPMPATGGFAPAPIQAIPPNQPTNFGPQKPILGSPNNPMRPMGPTEYNPVMKPGFPGPGPIPTGPFPMEPIPGGMNPIPINPRGIAEDPIETRRRLMMNDRGY